MNTSKEINTIILDLGGVIIDLDYNRTAKAFVNLGLNNFEDIYSKARQSNLFDDFEKGIISPDAFRSTLKEQFPENVSDEQIDEAWNAMLIDIPVHRVEFIKQLKQKYKVFLLSNTNAIHVIRFTKMADAIFGNDNFLRSSTNIISVVSLAYANPMQKFLSESSVKII